MPHRFNNSLLLLPLLACLGLAPEKHQFVWEDINTREVMRWEGDTAVIKQGAQMQELECVLRIDEKDVVFASESFGIPETWTTISYTDEQDLAQKQRELKHKAGTHGIKMQNGGNQFLVDYAWVITKSISPLRQSAKTIRSTAKRQGYRSTRELVGAFASFVQTLEYKIPSDFRMNEDSEKILTAGAMMPLETLSKKWGDCDTKSLLFASLVRSIDLVDVCFIVIDDHLFAGVQLRAEQDDHSIRHRGRDWVLVELSDSWPLGRIPLNHHNGIVKGKYEVVDLP
ncbi:MAG: hypothetical protein MK073_06200 [Phycisphaerales bacterium]|nr:hypothetical protein [Phycisphaerales bacterium]